MGDSQDPQERPWRHWWPMLSMWRITVGHTPLVRILYEYLVFLSKVPAKRTYSTYYPRYHNSTPTLLLSTTTNSTKLYQALPKQTQRKLLIGPSIHQQCYP